MVTPRVWATLSTAEYGRLAETFGTPYFLYDADGIRFRIDAVRSALDGLVRIYYAVKANPNLELLRSVRGVADGLDISSAGELTQAELAGFDMDSLSFAGPAKTVDELTTAIGKGVGCISVESERELEDCVVIAERLSRRANVSVRVNPKLANRSFGLKMGGKALQFGIDEEHLESVLETIRGRPDVLNFRGIHVYAGSQCFDPGGIVEGVADTLRIAREVEGRTGSRCARVNLGGGFGVSHGADGRELPLADLARTLAPTLTEYYRASPGEVNLLLELGRFLTAGAGIYVTRVISRKESRGKTFFVVDGGLHHHLAAAGTFGAALRSNFALANLSRPGSAILRCSIAGPSCNPTDLLAVDVELPVPERGDLIGVLNSGSYGLTASPVLFLGRPTPAELILRDGKVTLGRRPRTIVDFN